jgi:hypothetical protein
VKDKAAKESCPGFQFMNETFGKSNPNILGLAKTSASNAVENNDVLNKRNYEQ